MVKPLIRIAGPQDLDACVRVEHASFPREQAASAERIAARLEIFPQGYLVAELDGIIVGQAASGATDQDDFTDVDLKKMITHDPLGRHLVLFSLAVLPEYRGRGVASVLMERFIQAGRDMGKATILLLCLDELVDFYRRYGFDDLGDSASRYGGAVWREMRLNLNHHPE